MNPVRLATVLVAATLAAAPLAASVPQHAGEGQSGVAGASSPTARPADVASPEAILAALYAVISGDAGVERDWDRFRSLFYPGARMIPTGINARSGAFVARLITPEQYIETNGPYLEREGFHEVEVARRIERFGHIAHVFSTYESRHKLSDSRPFMRGINSIQLVDDGKRWWVLNIAWSQETPQFPIPQSYLQPDSGAAPAD